MAISGVFVIYVSIFKVTYLSWNAHLWARNKSLVALVITNQHFFDFALFFLFGRILDFSSVAILAYNILFIYIR